MGNESRTTGNCLITLLAGAALAATLSGCSGWGGYSHEAMFPEDVGSVCLKMFDNRSFRRGVEYELSDALAKRIEAVTPYKIVASMDRADSVMTGQLTSIRESALTIEREVAEPLEREVVLTAVVNWKNLNTGRLMINNQTITAAASYSEFLNQDFTYASALAANKLAKKIVESMENDW